MRKLDIDKIEIRYPRALDKIRYKDKMSTNKRIEMTRVLRTLSV